MPSTFACGRMPRGKPTGSGGGRIFPSGNGARCAKIIRPTATAGIIFRTITPAAGLIAGARMACWESPIANAGSVLRWRMWNGRDPILKERLFGLTGPEGNHGEDVKEQYFYLDSTPTHSYMKALYKYPQAPFPYEQLVQENGRRTRLDPEFEILDTGVFDQDRYFDVFVEYAKNAPDDILIRITVCNRGPDPATIHLAADAVGAQFVDLGLPA